MNIPFLDRFFSGIYLKNKDNKNIDIPLKPENDGSVEIFDNSFANYSTSYVFNNSFTFQNEIDLIDRYREMSLYPEVDIAIDDIINEAICPDNIKQIIEIDFNKNNKKNDLSENLKNNIKEEFQYIYQLLNFEQNGYELFKKWYVDGKLILYKNLYKNDENGKKGIASLTILDPRRIKKVKVYELNKKPNISRLITSGNIIEEFYLYNPQDITSEFFTNKTFNNAIKVSNDSITFVDSGILDSSKSIFLSNLHKAIKPLNQLKMIEDAIVIYRISRAPERRIFYIDVGNLPHKKAQEYLTQLMSKYQNKIVYDQTTGEVRSDRKFASMLEDYWIPRREGGRGTEITTLPSGQNLAEMADSEYFKNKLYKSLNIPISRLQPDNAFNLGRSAEITRDEIKFSKFTNRLQRKFEFLFIDLLKTQLIMKNIVSNVEEFEINIKDNIKFIWNKDAYFSELKNSEILMGRIRNLTDSENFIGKYFSREWIKKNILLQSDEEIEEIQKQIDEDNEKEMKLLSVSHEIGNANNENIPNPPNNVIITEK